MFLWPVRVYYEDTDSGGVVYYANYLRFLERARTELLRSKGLEQDVLAAGRGLIFVVRSLSIDYLQPACFNDRLLVSATPLRISGASIEFDQEILRQEVPEDLSDEGAVSLCRARVRVVCLDREAMRPRRIPADLKEMFH